MNTSTIKIRLSETRQFSTRRFEIGDVVEARLERSWLPGMEAWQRRNIAIVQVDGWSYNFGPSGWTEV